MALQNNRTAVELYYGLQDETWCWCGLLAPATQFLRSESECNASCPLYEEYYDGSESNWTEDTTEGSSRYPRAVTEPGYYDDYYDDLKCGGLLRMNVYKYTSPGRK